jgi:Flp pilus assembly pilin Flp
MRSLPRFVRDEDGQDLTEYTLGVAFFTLLSAAILLTAGSGTSGIWRQANNTLSGANTSLAAPVAPVVPADPGNGGDGNGDGDHHHHHHGGDGGG